MEEKKKNNKLKKLARYYNDAKNELKLTGVIKDDVHALVMACIPIQKEICEKSDDIKINDLEKIQNITPIDKSTYLEFVRICSLKNAGKLKEKAVTKFEDDFANRLFTTNIRHSFLNSYMNDSPLKVTDPGNEEYAPFEDYESSDFNDIMDESAKKREYINLVLRAKYAAYSKAAQYITDLKLTHSEFKKLVDFEYYKEGGYPTDKTPSKTYTIFKKYNDAKRLMNEYGFSEEADKLDYEFGLEVKLGEEHPQKHKWIIDEDDDEID